MKITYRGWAGHFCAASKCLFRLNTLIEHDEIRIVVSTVGAMEVGHNFEMIGLDRWYETMVFRAYFYNGYWEADIARELSYFDAIHGDELLPEMDNLAQDMHTKMIDRVRIDLLSGII